MTDTTSTDSVTTLTGMAIRFFLPVVALVFALAYVGLLYDEIRLNAMTYAYFAAGMTIVFAVSLIITESIRGSTEFGSAKEGLRDVNVGSVVTWATNRRNLLVVIFVSIVYLATVEVIGFFTASLIAMVLMMRLSGIKNPRVIALVTVFLLGALYLVIVVAMNQRLPTGILI